MAGSIRWLKSSTWSVSSCCKGHADVMLFIDRRGGVFPPPVLATNATSVTTVRGIRMRRLAPILAPDWQTIVVFPVDELGRHQVIFEHHQAA
jgi:hypothetical protein